MSHRYDWSELRKELPDDLYHSLRRDLQWEPHVERFWKWRLE